MFVCVCETFHRQLSDRYRRSWICHIGAWDSSLVSTVAIAVLLQLHIVIFAFLCPFPSRICIVRPFPLFLLMHIGAKEPISYFCFFFSSSRLGQ